MRVELDFVDFLDSLLAEFHGYSYEQLVEAVLAGQINCAGKDFLLVLQNRFHHFDCGRGWRVISTARFQVFHDFGAAVPSALDKPVDGCFVHQFRQRNAAHISEAHQRNHGVAVPTQHHRRHVLKRNIQLLCDERAKTSGVEDTGHSDHAFAREA